MTRTRVILHGAVAVFTALGICGGQELRAQDEMSPVAGIVRIGEVEVVHGEGFDAGAGLYQGIVLAGANPPNFGPPPSWPCFTGGGTGPCANLAAGGLVIPFPAQVVPVKGVGEIVWTFTTTTATGTADLHVKVTQSGATIYLQFEPSRCGEWSLERLCRQRQAERRANRHGPGHRYHNRRYGDHHG